MIEQFIFIACFYVVTVIVRNKQHVVQPIETAQIKGQNLTTGLLRLKGGQHITVRHLILPETINGIGQVQYGKRNLLACAPFMKSHFSHHHIELGRIGIPAHMAHRFIRFRAHHMAVRLQGTGESKQRNRSAEIRISTAHHTITSHTQTTFFKMMMIGILATEHRTMSRCRIGNITDCPSQTVNTERIPGKLQLSNLIPIHREKADARLQIMEQGHPALRFTLIYRHIPTASKDTKVQFLSFAIR